jgi:hypothetical protein
LSTGGQAAGSTLNWLGLVAFVVLCALAYLDSVRGKPGRAEGK